MACINTKIDTGSKSNVRFPNSKASTFLVSHALSKHDTQ
jgi:hypothetical protein